MAERRRRRKSNGSEDSEDISYSTDEERTSEKPTDLDNSTEIPNKVKALSEYGSAEEEEDGTAEVHRAYPLDDGLDNDLGNPVDEEGGQEERADLLDGDYIDDDGEWKDAEREEGDGEESEKQQGKEKVLDDDEDRRNPQYIPKKGGFYEHDDRLTEEAAEEEEKKKGKKKLWKDEGKWMHDRYREDEQNPKSRDELTALYGYDIRNEDGPPRARRRRRYGRGPSKYTRKWEDEDAYGKTTPTPRRVGRGGGPEESGPPRGQGGRGSQGRGYNRRGRISQESRTLSDEFPKLESNLVEDKREPGQSGDAENSASFRRISDDASEDCGRSNDRSVDENSGESNTTYPKGHPFPRSNRSRGRGHRSGRYNYNGRLASQRQTTERKWESPVEISSVTNDLEKLTIEDSNANVSTPAKEIRKEAKVSPTPHNTGSVPHERRQATVPPRMQDSAASRPKRYSSQRQRQMPDSVPYQQTPTPPPNASIPPRFYDTAYQPAVYPDHNSPNTVPQGTAPLIPPQPYQGYEGPYPDAYAMRPIATSPRMFSPVSLPAGQPVMPAPYIASGGNVMSYGPPPATYTQYPYQQYPAPPPPPPPQPVGDPLDNPLSALQPPLQEIFRGGMAYYNAQPPVRTLPKRPRAAIPIVPPPEVKEPRREDVNETSASIDTPPYEPQAFSNEGGNESEN